MARWGAPEDRIRIGVTADTARQLKRNARFLGLARIQLLHLIMGWAIRSGEAKAQVKLHVTYYRLYVRHAKARCVGIDCSRRMAMRMTRWAVKHGCDMKKRAWRAAVVRAVWEAWKQRQPFLVSKKLK